jgi:UDP-N-acetylglucosamine transferase subunit ALG13
VTTSDASTPDDAPGISRLFVTVGTDYHRFDRMVWWLDEWLAGEPKVGSVIVQRGTSAESERAESVEYLQRSQLVEEFQNASAVVCHGGPATILECRSNGIVPIVVPREERFDEHVNDHQVDFCERLATHGEIQLARTKDEFFRLLDLAVQRGAPIVAVDDGHAADSLANFEEEMVELLGPRARTLPLELAEVVPISSSVNKVPVLFVGSVPRSGSTIVSDLLNEHPHMVNIGELVHMWERGLIENNLCGCGQTFSDCEFWSKVGEIAFGGWGHISGERMHTLQRRADRTRYIPALLMPRVSRSMATSIVQYGAVITRILRAALEVSGAPVVVDTSKHVSTALLLRQLPDIDLRVLHLIRDPRGVANSWSKSIQRPEVQGENREMDKLHPGRIGLRWLWFNWAFSNMDRIGVPVATVRYEDFVVEPIATLDQIFDFADVDPMGDDILGGSEPVMLGEGHSVSGNPRRLERKPVEIRADEGWRTNLDPKMKQLVGRITRPMLSRYQYPKEP